MSHDRKLSQQTGTNIDLTLLTDNELGDLELEIYSEWERRYELD